ncbi:uncharacterized protein EV422DRAFT_206333 [Fimicolochytrium jonesii]|uniref:uncharacterized protein n=1 Tax=Fimicolochytrium jonesii TaxID=1396493 RepID=UPI0022FDFD73|nr:uncharacterized protein EV422DRAFT_206333 [Fimicolochytrium jonesii]KAI8817805.1 hypothetical protein EV422DRAFT_206333 [Fimicolochytrium jonesii]
MTFTATGALLLSLFSAPRWWTRSRCPWGTSPHTDPCGLDKLLSTVTELQGKVKTAVENPALKTFLDGFTEYYRSMYLREFLAGEAIIPYGPPSNIWKECWWRGLR